MKIGILTASRTANNGTDLQALAMLNLFKRLGAEDVEIINYICDKIESSKRLLTPFSLRKLLYFPINLYMVYTHNKFRKFNFQRSQILYKSKTLPTANYDAIVVGSDQIWNLQITGGDTSFFLPFLINKTRKYSYAASFGRTDLSKWESKFCISKLLGDFQGISCREESGVVALLKIGVTARYDLDPILMGRKDDWARFIYPKQKNKNPYILLYLIEYQSEGWMYAQKIAREKGYMVINCSVGMKYYRGAVTKRFVSIENWINLVANAEILITSSYHGLSFAILFKRDVRLITLKDSPQSSQRMENLLKRLGLDDHIICSPNQQIKSIDWDLVNNKLKQLRAESEQYVKSIIQS